VAEEHTVWVRSEGAGNCVVRKWTKWGLKPPPSLAAYMYVGEDGSSSSSVASRRLEAAEVKQHKEEDAL
jgi:hypothetical protein